MIVHCFRCNTDIKVIWSGTKQSLPFHDTHALMHHAIESFTKQEQNQEYRDSIDRSRRLILRCFNTLASQQEISSVQVASYLMGWPDHYASHNFVNVHLIGIERYLENSLMKVIVLLSNCKKSVTCACTIDISFEHNH